MGAVLDYITAGESHGRAVLAVVSGFPAGHAVDVEAINRDLALRQGGHGRSSRQELENDSVEFLSGLRKGRTLGSPIAMAVFNRDVRIDSVEEESVPRPGHAELAGALKYGTRNVREISERARARETAARVMAGSLARQVLKTLGVEVLGLVRSIGTVSWDGTAGDIERTRSLRDTSPVYCADKQVSKQMVDAIDAVAREGDTLGGTVEVTASGVVAGLGSCMTWQERLDGRLARALMSIQSVKGVSIGEGFGLARLRGNDTVDGIGVAAGKVNRGNNLAGGLEGGMTNGEDVVLYAGFKPIPTTNPPAPSIDLRTGKEVVREYERSDVCAVPAGAIIAEAVVSFELLRACCEKFGGDSVLELQEGLARYRQKIGGFFAKS
jgi:chorismate synthase